jgi:uncharacterized protein (TIGR02600 family)
MIFQARMRKRRSGIILVVVLASLALMTILLLALLRGSVHQVHGAESEASFAREKMLADSAVALVIGQIQQASTQPGQAWISQPGLLRTYDATASRKPSACYKLYSSTQMIDTGGTLDFLATDIPADWNSKANQSVYTDLNASQQTPGFLSRVIYPILDPAAVANVEGLGIDDNHGVEMPVEWLYQFQDGTFGSAGNGTKANPIVARIAFWTDDETCKININTAGCASPWNTPRVNSTDDVTWSANQPANGEFSSYPGHPATTSLAVVFGAGADSLSPEQLLGITPRYGFGGSQFGTQATAPGDVVPLKTDRLYASLDELCFGTSLNGAGQRQPNPISPDQLDVARFVLTAHSQAPETTLRGEPRVAIWPVSDAPQDWTRTTAADRAIQSVATVGTRNYFFQRHNAQSATDDLDPAVIPANARLFNELVARGSVDLPGFGTHFTQKYPGAKWAQIILELTDFIRGLNAIDPSPPPFVPYAMGDSSGLGRAFIVPLTTKYTSGTGQATLRGLGRCPTLSSLTLVFYVSGFKFNNNPADIVDYNLTPDDMAGTNWNKNFNLKSGASRWKNVTHELVRAFLVPCTFQPGCAYPEVSDACEIEIDGLDGMKISSGSILGDFGFKGKATSRLLSDALKVLPAERMWGGNEGPLAWRAAAQDTMNNVPYAFAGTTSFPVPLGSAPRYDAITKKLSWPPIPMITFSGVTGLTVRIRDSKGSALQTLKLDLPAFTVPAPTINGECDHMDGSTPESSVADWSTNPKTQVQPSYYMCLRNRLLATQQSRPFLIQAGDVSRSVEAATDLRVIAVLSTVPSTFFQPHFKYSIQTESHAHNLRFADGTSAYGASGYTQLVNGANYPNVTSAMTGTDWSDGTSMTPSYTWTTSPACSAPTSRTVNAFAALTPFDQPVTSLALYGDWDTGLGFAPDGAQIDLPDAGTALGSNTAYFSLTGGQVGSPTRRRPNALVPSPVIFGSLPAGIDPLKPEQSEPWRTLLFCPNPAADAAHPGFLSPPDHLLLDNFWMPVVEPYAISTCMATAGKINLNDQIAPFGYLHRSTAFHALLRDLRIPAIPLAMASRYKSRGSAIPSIWKPCDENATIEALEKRFATGDAYLSESEICTIPLIPKGSASDSVSLNSFWNKLSGGGRLTGDNLRELPYAQLYSRLTTRSNSYTVHVRVQVLQKLPHDPNQGVWNEGADLVLGDWRGSYEIERYLDSAAAVPAPGQPLGPYRYRIVSSRRFAP